MCARCLEPTAQPVILDMVVTRLQDPARSVSILEGLIFTLIMILSPFIESWAESQSRALLNRCGVRVQVRCDVGAVVGWACYLPLAMFPPLALERAPKLPWRLANPTLTACLLCFALLCFGCC